MEAGRLRTDIMMCMWAVALQDVEAAEDDHALGVAGAYLIEFCIEFYDDLIIDQVEFDAAHSYKLRRALTGIWGFRGMCPDVVSRIRAIQKSVPDPLPAMLSDADVERLVGMKTEGAA